MKYRQTIWIVIRDDGPEGFGNPIMAFREKWQAEQLQWWTTELGVTCQLIGVPMWLDEKPPADLAEMRQAMTG